MKARIILAIAVLTSWRCQPTAEGEPIAHWLAVAHTGSMKEQLHAIDLVTRMGKPAVPHLLTALERQPRFTREILRILGSMGQEADQAVPRLIQMLADKAPDNRVAAAVALLQIDCGRVEEALPVLIEGLQPDGQLAGLAATAAGLLGADGEPAVPALIRLLDAPDSSLRLNAVTALSRVGAPARQRIEALRNAAVAFPDLAPAARAAIESIEGTGMSPFPTCSERRAMGAELTKPTHR